ncbi:MAG: ROK family protein [Rubellimicrobium sp.]|nr:ROK family protein [Rubellimicrobium sp.]
MTTVAPPSCPVIGLDVGGTKIAGGLVDPATGRIIARREEPTEAGQGGFAALGRVERMARALAAEAPGGRVAGVGLGVPELVDRQGRLFSGYRIDWQGLPVVDRLSAHGRVRIEADVRAAALAEARVGAGHGMTDFLFVIVGTGISAVSVQNGVPYPGARGAALVLANGTTRHRCGECGAETAYVLEDVASGPGLVAAFRAAGGMADRAETVLEAARSGDARATDVIALAALRLGQALALLVGALDPEAVVLGGGLGSAPGPYFDAVAAEIRAGLWPDDSRSLPVLPARLGPDAGLIGAALGLAESLNQEPVNRSMHA